MSTKRTLIGNIKGPKGDTGAQGPQGATGPGATIEVGTVSTTAYGNTAQVTNSGTATAAVLDFVIPQGKPGEQTTKMSSLTLDTVTASTADYPIPATGDTGSVAWGKVIKFFNDAKTAIASKINISDIVNNLTSTATNKPLSAAQGKALNDAFKSFQVRTIFIQYTLSNNGNYNANLKTLIDADTPSGYRCLGIVGYTTNDPNVVATSIRYADSNYSFQVREFATAQISQTAQVFYLCAKS